MEDDRVVMGDGDGKQLPQDEVREARDEEVGFMQKRGIWSARPVEECSARTGRSPLSVRWVDTHNGGGE